DGGDEDGGEGVEADGAQGAGGQGARRLARRELPDEGRLGGGELLQLLLRFRPALRRERRDGDLAQPLAPFPLPLLDLVAGLGTEAGGVDELAAAVVEEVADRREAQAVEEGLGGRSEEHTS